MSVEEPTICEVTEWAEGLDRVHARIGLRFARAEPRRRALAYLRGLLSPIERKNGWQLAEEAGERTPDGMQRLLSTAEWDAGAVRDDLVAYVVEHLADSGAILVLDETGFLKKGTKSAGVQRQYTGTAGKRENCQIGVFVTYATPQAHVLVDRELYLPQSWTSDPVRCQEAGIPAGRAFATKPELARTMLERLQVAGLPAAWVTGDTVYGGSPALRTWLQKRRQPYVLAIAANDGVDLPYGDSTMHVLPEEIAQYALDPPEWRRLSAGEGAKGPRLYGWALVPLAAPSASGFEQALLIRRPLEAPDDLEQLAYYLTFAPVGTPIETLVAVAGQRWNVEEDFEHAKGEVGLDHYEVRHWIGWYRHITLAMLALAYLAVVRARLRQEAEPTGKGACRASVPLNSPASCSRSRCPRCAGWSIGSSGSPRRSRSTSCTGRSGGGGINNGPSVVTIGAARPCICCWSKVTSVLDISVP
jgi:SRSO17 transposase